MDKETKKRISNKLIIEELNRLRNTVSGYNDNYLVFANKINAMQQKIVDQEKNLLEKDIRLFNIENKVKTLIGQLSVQLEGFALISDVPEIQQCHNLDNK